MKIIPIILLVFSSLSELSGQGLPAYKIFNKKGKKISYKKMVKSLAKKDIVLFGEFHNNPIAHWLELKLMKDLDKRKNLILGAEMLETDNQSAIDAYLKDQIDEIGLDSLARLWGNYSTDYAPLVDYAKEKDIPVIATNIPRRYASMVYKNGGFAALDDLAEKDKKWIAPLPIPFDAELPTYKGILDMMGGHGGEDLVKAQAIKDATMAYFILKHYEKEKLFLHVNGAYHSDFFEGIVWYIQESRKDLELATISTVSQEQLKKLLQEHKGKADFIICVDSDMTTTY